MSTVNYSGMHFNRLEPEAGGKQVIEMIMTIAREGQNVILF